MINFVVEIFVENMKKITFIAILLFFIHSMHSKEYKFDKYFIYKNISRESITFINSENNSYYMIKYSHNNFAMLFDMASNMTLFYDFISSVNDDGAITFTFTFTHEYKTLSGSHILREHPNLYMEFNILNNEENNYTIELLYYTNKRKKNFFGKQIIKAIKQDHNYFYVFRNACQHGFEKQNKFDIKIPFLITHAYYFDNDELKLGSELIDYGDNYFKVSKTKK